MRLSAEISNEHSVNKMANGGQRFLKFYLTVLTQHYFADFDRGLTVEELELCGESNPTWSKSSRYSEGDGCGQKRKDCWSTQVYDVLYSSHN